MFNCRDCSSLFLRFFSQVFYENARQDSKKFGKRMGHVVLLFLKIFIFKRFFIILLYIDYIKIIKYKHVHQLVVFFYLGNCKYLDLNVPLSLLIKNYI